MPQVVASHPVRYNVTFTYISEIVGAHIVDSSSPGKRRGHV